MLTSSVLAMTGAAAVAFIVGFLVATYRATTAASVVTGDFAKLRADAASSAARMADMESDRRDLRDRVATLSAELDTRAAALGAARASLEAERTQGEEKIALLQNAKEDMSHQFKALAAEIFEDRSRRFTEVNQTSMTALLTPLQAELAGFRQRVDEVYVNESKDRSALAEQVRALSELNGTLREETTNLTRALIGSAKEQGDWGELVLSRLLESVSFIEGKHYTSQAQQVNEDGVRVIPDIVLHLPQSRDMVVDSKVSLTAYTAYTAESDGKLRRALLEQHLLSVRQHIKSLGAKNYHELYDTRTLDCVVMFMPLEGAFMAAVTAETDLFQMAWDRNVLLVSPSTFLFVIRTLAHVWRQEDQSRHSQDIASRGKLLLEKFVAFGDDLLDVGKHLDRAQVSYAAAKKKLTDGKGNLVQQAESLRNLGLRPRKNLSPVLLGAANIDDDEQEDDDNPSSEPTTTGTLEA